MLNLEQYGFTVVARAPQAEMRSLRDIVMSKLRVLFAGVEGTNIKEQSISVTKVVPGKEMNVSIGWDDHAKLPSIFMLVDEEATGDSKYFHKRSSASFTKKSVMKGNTKSIDECFKKCLTKAMDQSVDREFYSVYQQILKNVEA